MRWLLLAITTTGCTVDDRALLEVPVLAGGTDAELATSGGTVVLSEASVTFSDLRLEEPSALDLASRVTNALYPAAYAHPGHDYPGDVAGELLGTFTVDLLAEDAELGSALCYEGPYATARIGLEGAVSTLVGDFVDGQGVAHPFRFEVDASQPVTGIPFVTELSAEGAPAAIELRFDPEQALRYVDWTPDEDGDGLLTGIDGTFANTVRFGVVATPSWSLVVAP